MSPETTGSVMLCLTCGLPCGLGVLVGWLLRGRAVRIGRFWWLPAPVRRWLLEGEK